MDQKYVGNEVQMPWVFADDLPDIKLSKKEEAEIEEYARSKKRKLRVYTDADVPRQAVEMLRERKLNVLTAQEAGKDTTRMKTTWQKLTGKTGFL